MIYPADSAIHRLNNWGLVPHNSLCFLRTERTWIVKLRSQFSFCYLENMLKGRLSKTSCWQFLKWLFGPEKFSGPSRNGPLVSIFVQQRSTCWMAHFNIRHVMTHCLTFVEQQLQHLLINKCWTVCHRRNPLWTDFSPIFFTIIGIFYSYKWTKYL